MKKLSLFLGCLLVAGALHFPQTIALSCMAPLPSAPPVSERVNDYGVIFIGRVDSLTDSHVNDLNATDIQPFGVGDSWSEYAVTVTQGYKGITTGDTTTVRTEGTAWSIWAAGSTQYPRYTIGDQYLWYANWSTDGTMVVTPMNPDCSQLNLITHQSQYASDKAALDAIYGTTTPMGDTTPKAIMVRAQPGHSDSFTVLSLIRNTTQQPLAVSARLISQTDATVDACGGVLAPDKPFFRCSLSGVRRGVGQLVEVRTDPDSTLAETNETNNRIVRRVDDVLWKPRPHTPDVLPTGIKSLPRPNPTIVRPVLTTPPRLVQPRTVTPQKKIQPVRKTLRPMLKTPSFKNSAPTRTLSTTSRSPLRKLKYPMVRQKSG